MHQYSTLLFALFILMSCYEFTPAIVYTNKSYAKDDIEPQSPSVSITNYVKLNNAAIQHKKISLNSQDYKWRYHNINVPFEEDLINSNSETSSAYTPAIYNTLNYNNLDVVSNLSRQLQLGSAQQSKIIYDAPNELSTANNYYIYDPHQLVKKLKHTGMSSNDHLKRRHLATYVTPSPSNLEMHPNLHHHIPAIIYKTPTIMSHATGNEPSPMTTESIKSLASIKNVQHISTTDNYESLIINNKVNYYDNIAKGASNINIHALQVNSKQYVYAPLRSSVEKELPYNSNSLPYPPSFISITTTDAPSFRSKPVNNNIPDLFTHRQYKSLLDSYIPSWHIAKMLQQFKYKHDKNNLHTLAFSKHNKMKIEK